MVSAGGWEEREMPESVQGLLTSYLTDAHSIEMQALAQLKTAPEIAGDSALSGAFRDHLGETEGHERLIASLLEERGAKPSRVKDAVMSVGSKDFVLFARLQPDTPGNLAAHALSYEALELASYELLARVADRVGEPNVSGVARQIAAEERRMMRRLENGFDRSSAASLEALRPRDLKEQVRKYLADAHAIEEQAIQLLERAPGMSGGARALPRICEEHLGETRSHADRIAERLKALGGDTSSLKDAALRLGALNWAAFFQAHPDTAGKLAVFAFAFEYLEIGGYEQLRRVAERAGDGETGQLAEGILEQERAAAAKIAEQFDEAAAALLTEQGVTT
jgi:ferritin-like metal-binding protein YciE